MQQMLTISQALLVTLLNIAVIIVFTFIGAALSDRHGNRRMALIGSGLMVLVGLPIWWLATQHDTALIIIGQFGLAAILGLYYVPEIVIVNRSFPTRLRYAGHSISHNFAAAAFGGTSALGATYLLHATGNVLSPVFWPLGLAALSFAVVWTYPRLFRGERADDA